MDTSLKTIMWAILFILLMALNYDIKQASRFKSEIKNALDLSTKAAAMQVDENATKIGKGIFDIDNDKAKTVFVTYMKENLPNSEGLTFMKVEDYKAINPAIQTESPVTRISQTYTNSYTGKTYKITKPTFIAVVRYTYSGIFIKQSIVIDNIGATRINN